MKSFNWPVDENDNPILSECSKVSFILLYTSPEVASAFGLFWDNHEGIQDKMMDFWKVVAEKFKDNPTVAGYDVMNEPWVANLFHDSMLFLDTQKFDREKLFPFSQKAHNAIRTVDDKKIIFFEPSQFPDTLPFFGGITMPIGFPETPGGSDYLDRQALNDHIYCCQVEKDMCIDGEPHLENREVCRKFHAHKVSRRRESAAFYKVPLIWTEFGACFDGERCAVEIKNACDAFDDNLSSWNHWMFKSFGDHTTHAGPAEGMFTPTGPQKMKLRALTRTYIHAW